METLESYLDRLASESAVPGGGSAAALTGAMAAALIAMVARIAQNSPKHAAYAEELEAIADCSDALRAELTEARTRDEAAYAAVVAAQGLPRESEEQRRERRQSLDDALARAAEEPLHAAALNLQLLELTERLLEIPLEALISDVGSAAELAAAALGAAAYNVRANHRYMRDAEVVELQRASLDDRQAQALAALQTVRERVGAQLERSEP